MSEYIKNLQDLFVKYDIAAHLKASLNALVRYAYLPLAVLYFELLLRVLTGGDFSHGAPFYIFFAFSAGALINLLLQVKYNRKAFRIIGGIILGVLGLVFTLQYFMYGSFQAYMTFSTIIIEARNVLSNFADVVLRTALRAVPQILGFASPLILFLIFTIKHFKPEEETIYYETKSLKSAFSKLRYAIVAFILFILTAGGWVVTLRYDDYDRAAFFEEYNFESSGRRLGVLPAVSLDMWYSFSGYRAESGSFDISQIPSAIPSLTDTAQTDTGANDFRQDIPVEQVAPETPEPEPEPIVYGFNVLDIDFERLIENERNSEVIAIHEYISSLEPSSQNAYTGLFAGKNLILICAEALTNVVVDPVMTPTLYRLTHNGIYFSDFYQPAWGAGTAGGEFSILAGFPPTDSSMSTLTASTQNNSYMISTRLQNLGYFTAAFHNGSHTYYNRDQSHPNIGYDEYIAFGGGLNDLMGRGWSASDVDLMEATVPYYINNSPFSVYYMTYSGHAGYTIGNPIARRNWDAFPEQYSEMPDPIRAYMAANLEFEYAMAFLVEALEEAGIADDTVIVIGSDHYPYGLRRSETWDNDIDFIAELFGVETAGAFERDQSAGIIWSGCLENEYKDMAVEISAPASTLDFMPTLLNLFGLEFDSRLYPGRDVLSDAAPLVFWLNRSWITQDARFDASRNSLIATNENTIIPEDYADAVRSVVNNRIRFSRAVLDYDYFGRIFNADGTLREFEE